MYSVFLNIFPPKERCDFNELRKYSSHEWGDVFLEEDLSFFLSQIVLRELF